MATRRFFVGGNWKSNNTLKVTQDLINKVYNKLVFNPEKVEVICAPVFVHLPWVKANAKNNVQVSAQNTSATKYGAYTGEITCEHIKDLGIRWTILGHSERRSYYGESSDIVAKKTKLALDTGLDVIACVGEKLEERESGDTMKVIESQLNPIRALLSEAEWARVVVAYEPVWAIGTGKVASNEQAQEVHAFIRSYLGGVSSSVSDSVRIIYGGSVTEKNSDALIQQQDIDGFLVGGAALKPAFADIVKSANKGRN